MTPTLILINIIGGVSLMLWSLKLVRLGVTRAFGADLRRVLSVSTENRFLALIFGAAVTALLQSSTATVMLVSSFAGQAMVTTSAALALILGADVGTTLVAQIMTFDLSWLFPLLLIAGVALFSYRKTKNYGRVCIGLGLILLSLAWIRESAAPLADSQTLPLILLSLQNDAVLAIVVAVLMTWLAHSSLAVVLLLMSLTATGVLPVSLGLYMVLGANLGGTIAPLTAMLRDSPAALRVPAGNMLMRFIGVLAVFPFVGLIEPALLDLGGNSARQIVNFHMAFNIVLAVVFLPLTGIVAALCLRFLPDRTDLDDPALPKYLNEKEINAPAIALASATRETLRMAEKVQTMLADTIKAFRNNDESLVEHIREKEDILDSLYTAIKNYMVRLTQESMDEKDASRYVQILTFATNLEHAGDVIDKNLMPLALKKIRNQRSFSEEGFKEIENIHTLVLENVVMAQNVFVSGDVKLARNVLEAKEIIRLAEIKASTGHIERLREGVPETVATSSLHLDIIRDYRRINSYMSAVAYPVLEDQGSLPSRRLEEAD